MRKATAFTAVLLLGVGMSPGQDGKEPPAKPDPKAPWSQAVEGLRCWLEPDKAVWKVDEVPSFRLHVRNQGKRDLVIHIAAAAAEPVRSAALVTPWSADSSGARLDTWWAGPVSARGWLSRGEVLCVRLRVS